jgi:hypothetical protein
VKPIDFAKALGVAVLVLALDLLIAVLDGASVAFEDFFILSIGLTMLLKLIGALSGAYVSQRQRPI